MEDDKAVLRLGAAKKWREGMAIALPISVWGRVKRQRVNGNDGVAEECDNWSLLMLADDIIVWFDMLSLLLGGMKSPGSAAVPADDAGR